jgi:hypothetical protein
MEFEYSFEASRNPPNGYVHHPSQTKLSFVGNSGVKFGGKEVAILDVAKMVAEGGGLAAFDPDEGGGINGSGVVSIGPYASEDLSKLMTGVAYAGDYEKMADNPNEPNVPGSADDYFELLENNVAHTNGQMKIDVTKTGDDYVLEVYLDESENWSYRDADFPLSSFTTLDLQSHWGSGVIFTSMDIIAK